ncbi:Fatty acid hydroxylase [Cinara cedri]|uniref:Fatty acid hydroxylase n=1 Tax=Cinara cedri TaxID=506608 RepID=A0A5E4NHW9_9HEMI|nr:Fatty acid hydroxylase [Cinara cedri]
MIVLALIAAAFMNGNWLAVVAHTQKYHHDGALSRPACRSFFDEFKSQCIWAMAVGYGVYFGFCGYLEWKYYVRGRGKELEWKCQPRRYLPGHLVWDQIKWGCTGLMVTNVVSAVVATHVVCGGYSRVYMSVCQYPFWWWILQWPVIFVQQDYATYWIHRTFHTKFLFKHFHSLHHRYFQPTPWSVTAIHPFEITLVQLSMVVPIFIYPVHWVPFYGLALYTYYHGIIQHSGINFKARRWQPWQPDSMFHDNHHQYCHVNFGFNCYMWDQIHGSARKPDCCYNERTDGWGSGRPLASLSENDLRLEIRERAAENPKAYRDNMNPYSLLDEFSTTVKTKTVE